MDGSIFRNLGRDLKRAAIAIAVVVLAVVAAAFWIGTRVGSGAERKDADRRAQEAKKVTVQAAEDIAVQDAEHADMAEIPPSPAVAAENSPSGTRPVGKIVPGARAYLSGIMGEDEALDPANALCFADRKQPSFVIEEVDRGYARVRYDPALPSAVLAKHIECPIGSKFVVSTADIDLALRNARRLAKDRQRGESMKTELAD